MLRVENVFKSYLTPQGPLPVLQGVDLTLDAGSSLALMGESGSGKSTLLHWWPVSTRSTAAASAAASIGWRR
jgi:ABC-type lipoprotein export system ATPase subunit